MLPWGSARLPYRRRRGSVWRLERGFRAGGGSGAHRWPPAPRACIELPVWVGLVAARGPRKSRREGVWVLPELFYFGSKRRLALRPLPPVAVSLHCEMKCLSSTSPHPKRGTRSLPTSPSHLPSVPLPSSGSLVSRGIMQISPLPCFTLLPPLPATAPAPPRPPTPPRPKSEFLNWLICY